MSEIEIFHGLEDVDDELIQLLLSETVIQRIVELTETRIAALTEQSKPIRE